MRKNFNKNLGMLLILFGFLFLLQSLNILQGTIGNAVWMILMGGVSIFFFNLYVKRKSQFWWMILGIVFLAAAARNLVGLLNLPDWVQDGIIFGGIGLGFILIYLSDRINWWALIPGGLVISIGIINILDQLNPTMNTDGVLFFGLGVTFLLLFLIPTQYGRMNWPLVPSLASIGIGFLLNYDTNGNILGYVGPSLLVLSGFLILFFTIRRKK